MRKYRQFTEEDVTKVAKLNSMGYSRNDIALSIRLPKHIVYYIMYKKLLIPRVHRSKQAVIRKERRLDDNTINKIIVLTNFGYQCREIAEDQQIPEPLVKQVIENARLKKLIEKKC